MRIALDTNVLVYAEAVNGDRRRDQARALIDRLHLDHEIVIPVQCLGELHRVLTGKARMPSALAAEVAHGWRRLAVVVPSTEDALVAAAADAECRLLLSEDMQDGFVYRGVTVANPFAETPHPLLASLLETF